MQPEDGMITAGGARPTAHEAPAGMKKYPLELNPLTIGGAIVAIVAVILLVATVANLLKANPYGPETRIDNFSKYYSGVPGDRQSMVFAALYTAVAENVAEGAEVPTAGAMVRNETAEYEYDEATAVYYGRFVVDIESVQQSYMAQFGWSPVKNNQYVDGYEVLILCVPKDLRIYENNTTCQDMFSGNVEWGHEYQWQYVLGGQSMRKIEDLMRDLIVKDDPLASYTATIDEASLKKLNVGEDIAYRSEVVVGDTTRYRLTMRTDTANSVKYIALYVTEVDGDVAEGYVLIDSRLNENEQDALKVEMTNWLRSVSGKANLEIEYRVEKLAV